MKRFIGTITTLGGLGAAQPNDPPEVAVLKAVDNDFLPLPTIVEAAESSPAAAKVAANQIHKYLSKPATSHPRRQYNAIMLIRILADNPGTSFTCNLDARFTSSVKLLLRDGRDMNVAQILRETLETLSTTKANDRNLSGLIQMWTKEKEKFERTYGYPPFGSPPVQSPHGPGLHAGQRQDYFSRQHKLRGLPPPGELAARVNEANESAKLLQQMLMSTPISEFYHNEMIKEFATRCQSASRSVQGYINSSNPAPDEDTMLTLIETNDKISVALSRYNRVTLDARKAGFRSPDEQDEQAQYLIDRIPDHNQRNGHGNQDYRNGQPHPQATGALPTGDAALERGQSKKQRYIPRLSMPRMPKKLSKQSSEQAPVRNEAKQPTLYTPPVHSTDVERAPISPPVSPPGTHLNNQPLIESREVHGSHDSGALELDNEHLETRNDNHIAPAVAAPPISWEYNPNEFQVENPFADKFATDANSGLESNRVSRITEPDGTSATIHTNRPDEPTQSTKRGRYYSGSDFSLFDNTKPGPSEALAIAPEPSPEKKQSNPPSAHI
ncbi:hypothetical protein MGYG_07095 [Nannizzia gypsea CBS 118893]|uniref:GAT domain-containing protein n=1 Tax=Arthroderma gypseum (strain ATCC MYA-4604 / CBS 118893) TaxID=535722 RepID=E4V223_ARTGP|nr:hypothetical protein MGYG_07095 [Nannizzia gypsea CBS 118893]EFR04088.1 hypothetical protein MGYG_07095 [Nannizzia gypsea CBS 118893]